MSEEGDQCLAFTVFTGNNAMDHDMKSDSDEAGDACRNVEKDSYENDEEEVMLDVEDVTHAVVADNDDDIPQTGVDEALDQVEESWYSWLVLTMAFLCMILSMSGYFSFAVLLVEWKEYFNTSTSGVALIGAIQLTTLRGFSEYYYCQSQVSVVNPRPLWLWQHHLPVEDSSTW